MLPWRHRNSLVFAVQNYVREVSVRNNPNDYKLRSGGEETELHDQRPALKSIGHGEQKMLTKLKVFRQYSRQDVLSS